MAHRVKLYMFSGSAPSLTARLMLEHKGIDHKTVHCWWARMRLACSAAASTR